MLGNFLVCITHNLPVKRNIFDYEEIFYYLHCIVYLFVEDIFIHHTDFFHSMNPLEGPYLKINPKFHCLLQEILHKDGERIKV